MVTPSDFGSPSTTSSYTMCLYDQSALKMTATAAAGGTCGTKPCWKSSGDGFKYADKNGAGEGLTKIALKPGAAGKAKISVAGKGANLHLPTLPLSTPVTIQVKRSDGSACWRGVFSMPSTSSSSAFSARSD